MTVSVTGIVKENDEGRNVESHTFYLSFGNVVKTAASSTITGSKICQPTLLSPSQIT